MNTKTIVLKKRLINFLIILTLGVILKLPVKVISLIIFIQPINFAWSIFVSCVVVQLYYNLNSMPYKSWKQILIFVTIMHLVFSFIFVTVGMIIITTLSIYFPTILISIIGTDYYRFYFSPSSSPSNIPTSSNNIPTSSNNIPTSSSSFNYDYKGKCRLWYCSEDNLRRDYDKYIKKIRAQQLSALPIAPPIVPGSIPEPTGRLPQIETTWLFVKPDDPNNQLTHVSGWGSGYTRTGTNQPIGANIAEELETIQKLENIHNLHNWILSVRVKVWLADFLEHKHIALYNSIRKGGHASEYDFCKIDITPRLLHDLRTLK